MADTRIMIHSHSLCSEGELLSSQYQYDESRFKDIRTEGKIEMDFECLDIFAFALEIDDIYSS